jgi:hypothetical protein
MPSARSVAEATRSTADVAAVLSMEALSPLPMTQPPTMGITAGMQRCSADVLQTAAQLVREAQVGLGD